MRSTVLADKSHASVAILAKVRANMPLMEPFTISGGSAGSTSITPGREYNSISIMIMGMPRRSRSARGMGENETPDERTRSTGFGDLGKNFSFRTRPRYSAERISLSAPGWRYGRFDCMPRFGFRRRGRPKQADRTCQADGQSTRFEKFPTLHRFLFFRLVEPQGKKAVRPSYGLFSSDYASVRQLNRILRTAPSGSSSMRQVLSKTIV